MPGLPSTGLYRVGAAFYDIKSFILKQTIVLSLCDCCDLFYRAFRFPLLLLVCPLLGETLLAVKAKGKLSFAAGSVFSTKAWSWAVFCPRSSPLLPRRDTLFTRLLSDQHLNSFKENVWFDCTKFGRSSARGSNKNDHKSTRQKPLMLVMPVHSCVCVCV